MIELLQAIAHVSGLQLTIGVPERLGDRCFGVELGGKRLAIIEPAQLPFLRSILPEGPLLRLLKDV